MVIGYILDMVLSEFLWLCSILVFEPFHTGMSSSFDIYITFFSWHYIIGNGMKSNFEQCKKLRCRKTFFNKLGQNHRL